MSSRRVRWWGGGPTTARPRCCYGGDQFGHRAAFVTVVVVVVESRSCRCVRSCVVAAINFEKKNTKPTTTDMLSRDSFHVDRSSCPSRSSEPAVALLSVRVYDRPDLNVPNYCPGRPPPSLSAGRLAATCCSTASASTVTGPRRNAAHVHRRACARRGAMRRAYSTPPSKVRNSNAFRTGTTDRGLLFYTRTRSRSRTKCRISIEHRPTRLCALEDTREKTRKSTTVGVRRVRVHSRKRFSSINVS